MEFTSPHSRIILLTPPPFKKTIIKICFEEVLHVQDDGPNSIQYGCRNILLRTNLLSGLYNFLTDSH